MNTERNYKITKNQLQHRYFSSILPTILEHLFPGTPLNGCFWNCIQWEKSTQSHEHNVLSEVVPVSVLNFHIQVTEDTVLTKHSPTSTAYRSAFQFLCDTGTSSSTFDFTATFDYLQKFMQCRRFCHLHR